MDAASKSPLLTGIILLACQVQPSNLKHPAKEAAFLVCHHLGLRRLLRGHTGAHTLPWTGGHLPTNSRNFRLVLGFFSKQQGNYVRLSSNHLLLGEEKQKIEGLIFNE